MEIQITFDSASVKRTIDDALSGIEGLRETMPAELTDWQEQDMGRSRPNTSAPDAQTAETLIWPRARQIGAYGVRRPRPRLLRARRQPQPGGSAATVHVRRPILRPELLTLLRERMRELLGKTFTWH